MATLTRDLRKTLENTVKEARRVAEDGAKKAIESLAVHHHEPWPAMTAEQKALRNKLRVHGRQLGDMRDARKETQAINHLVSECAYEHWHRMLFARFLAENNLLIEPSTGVAITLQECQELARERSADWLEMASGFAERMLPQIFRQDDPVLEVMLPAETRSRLEDTLKALPSDIFLADDSLGWVYQFWQAEKKDEVNRSEKKIGADELPAVTQLFTEDYMVLFLLHNTLGAWWAGKELAAKPDLALSARSEDELRAACTVGGIELSFLRFARDGEDSPWKPAAGTFDGWPKAAKDITFLDPCMGSGHFLVFALPILVAFRRTEEGLSEEAAVEAVLRDNLFGLEIDPRCTQIAAFNLALAAWRYVGYRQLPKLNLACSGLSLGMSRAEWDKLAERAAASAPIPPEQNLFGTQDNLFSARIKEGLFRLYDLFAQAPTLGSLINPRSLGETIFAADFVQFESLFGDILRTTHTDDLAEMAVAAQGLAKAAEILAGQFTLVATNVPYLAGDKQSPTLYEFCENSFPISKRNLGYVFMERMVAGLSPRGTVAMVGPQNWLFQPAYPELRKLFLRNSDWKLIVRLGTKAFQTPMWDLNVLLFIASKTKPSTGSQIRSINAEGIRSSEEKAACLSSLPIKATAQLEQLKNPDYIVLEVLRDQTTMTLGYLASTAQGLVTGDDNKFIRRFWESATVTREWKWLHLPPRETTLCAGRVAIIRWDEGRGDLHNRSNAHNFPPPSLLGRPGIAIQRMNLNATLYDGDIFGDHVAPLIPNDRELILPLWCFCASPAFALEVRRVDSALKAAVGSFLKIPFDLVHWQQVAKEKYPDGLPQPYSSDTTQWIFYGHPKKSDHPLQVAVARLLGYQWPRQIGSSFMDCPALGPDGLERHTDGDGIVCLSPLHGEYPADQRLIALLADAFGTEWSAGKLASLVSAVGFEGKTLDDWLRDGFFEQHCELFHQRPFVWHVWDGRRDGFHALVNYHKLAATNGEGKRTLETLIYTYLGDWIDKQRKDQKAGVEGADGRAAAAEYLKIELEKILAGEPPYDIFVRWKPLNQQAIGWGPDINDGVRLNIRPFMAAKPLAARARGVCILRATPKIKWEKDRGKEPNRTKEEFPWFWGWDGQTQDFVGGRDFDGNRWNDLHYTVAFKQAARARRT